MVNYLSGNIIEGSSTSVSAPPATSWKELARGTGSGGTTIDSGTFTAKDNIMVLGHITQGRVYLTYNGSTGNEYANRRSEEGGSDSTQTSQDKLDMSRNLGEDVFFVGDTVNVANQEKFGIYHACSQNSAGAGNTPKRQEWVTKYVPSSLSTNITSVKITTDSGTYDSNDQIVVLGYDNDEADTGTNFWQELGSATASGGETTLTVTLSSSKKYLYYVMYKIPHSSGDTADLRINSNTGSVYAGRTQSDGGTDYAYNSTSRILTDNGGYTVPSFSTGYIVDVASKEKLLISESISQGTAGAGNTPNRRESVGKTSETARITALNMYTPDENGFLAGTYIKVWGAD